MTSASSDSRSDLSLSRLLPVVDWFIPATLRDPVTLLRAQLFVVLSGLVAINAALFAALHTVHHVPGSGRGVIWALIGLLGIGLTMPVLLRLGAPFRWLAPFLALMVSVGLGTTAALDGGLASGSVFWLLAIPLGAAFMGGARLGWASAALSLAIGLGLFVATRLGVVFPDSLGPADHALHYAVNFSAAVVFVPALASLYEGPMVRHFRHLSGQLQTVNAELRRELSETARAHGRVEAANRAKDALLANMSHEFRTPLTAILGFTDILTDEVAPEHRPYLASIDRGAHRLLGTLDGVLGLAWIESSTGLDDALADLRREALGVAEALRPLAEARRLRLAVHGPSVCAAADPTALRRVLHALVDNAVRFTDSGGVSVDVAADGDRARVTITDTGIGIADDFLETAFEPFRQASEGHARTHEGVGVGLTMAQRLVEVMDGEIHIDSVLGRGTTVVVTFPRAGADAGTLEREAAPAVEWAGAV